MKEKKTTGAYYTPGFLADFIYSRLEKNLKTFKNLSILEPSVGNGSFLDSLLRSNIYNENNISIKAIDVNRSEILRLRKRSFGRIHTNFLHKDFLRFKPDTEDLYSLIIGNPPYIKKGLLSGNQKIFGKRIHEKSELSEKTFKNIWSVFLVKSITLLDDNGILAFILPSEILQVKYANELKNHILKMFKRVEIYTFSDLMFECKGQNTIILIGYKKHSEEGVYYTHISDIKQKENKNITLIKNETIQSLDIKWTHHTLDSKDLEFLNEIRESLNRVKDYCISKPGIVTAANSFFIINSDTEEKYKWEKYTKPILQKGMFFQTGIIFSYSDYKKLSTDGKPIKLICLKEENIDKLNEKNKEYLLLGEKMNIQNRYKCRIRDNWLIIPNISEPPEGFFFKRSHLFPKLVKNEANVLATDSAYNIEMIDNYNINSFIFSFYNSLTFVFSELGGRYYGGGVLELTPKEFKNLPVPYQNISNTEFKDLSHRFKNCKNIKEILNHTDFLLLSKIGLNKEEIKRVQNLRDILSLKRCGIK
jgi:adenine-specific DNA-methyltransferase